jgi:hypothetical protein
MGFGFYFVLESQSKCKVRLSGSFSVMLGRDLFSGLAISFMAWIKEITLMENKDILKFRIIL